MKRMISGVLFVVALSIAGNLLAVSAGTVAFPPDARSSVHLYNLPGLDNVGRVAPSIFRGAQPGREGYDTLKRMGFRTVIDLRTTANERRQVEEAGMTAIAVPIEMSRNGLREKVERVVALMADPLNRPVFVHCRHGQDRTGIVMAAYRMKHQGWSLADAEAEMQDFGFNDVWVTFKSFIRHYGAQTAGKQSTTKEHTP